MNTRDIFGLIPKMKAIVESDLGKALAVGKTTDSSDTAIAFLWCEYAGKCRLFGVDVEERLDANPNVVRSALPCAENFVRESINDALLIGEDLASASSQFEIDDIVCTPLESRLKYWAFNVVVTDVVEEASGKDRHEVRQMHELFLKKVDEFDRVLMENLELVSLIAETSLLDNWRASLREPFSDPGPWWLDGRIERRLAQSEHEPMPQICNNITTVVAFGMFEGKREKPGSVAVNGPLSLAAGKKTQLSGFKGQIRWANEDGTIYAHLSKPRSYGELQTPVRFEFLMAGSHDRPEQLIGKTVNFGKLEKKIEFSKGGRVIASFDYRELVGEVESGNGKLLIENTEWTIVEVSN